VLATLDRRRALSGRRVALERRRHHPHRPQPPAAFAILGSEKLGGHALELHADRAILAWRRRRQVGRHVGCVQGLHQVGEALARPVGRRGLHHGVAKRVGRRAKLHGRSCSLGELTKFLDGEGGMQHAAAAEKDHLPRREGRAARTDGRQSVGTAEASRGRVACAM
jgi:hypothetical protein